MIKKGKEPIGTKLADVIFVLVGKHKASDPVCWTWQEEFGNQPDYLHEINMSKIRNSDVNKVSNSRNTNEEITLDLSIENNEKLTWIRPDCIFDITVLIYCCVLMVYNTLYRPGLTQRQRKCPVTSNEDFVWN
jgi:hypothetical protein